MFFFVCFKYLTCWWPEPETQMWGSRWQLTGTQATKGPGEHRPEAHRVPSLPASPSHLHLCFPSTCLCLPPPLPLPTLLYLPSPHPPPGLCLPAPGTLPQPQISVTTPCPRAWLRGGGACSDVIWYPHQMYQICLI